MMSSKAGGANPVDKASVYLAGGLLSAFGATMYAAASPFLVLLGKRFGLGEGQQGDVIAMFFLGFTLIALLMSVFMRRQSWRRDGLLYAGVAIVAITALPSVTRVETVYALMVLAGIGMGGVYTIALTLFGTSGDPDRAMGIKLGIETFPGMILLYLIPVLDARFGINGAIGAIVALAGIAMIATRFIPASNPRVETVDIAAGIRFNRAALCGCLACLAFIAGTYGLWSFLAQIAGSKGFPEQQTAAVLSIAYFAVGSGSLLAALLGDRAGRAIPICLGGVAYAAGAFGVAFIPDVSVFSTMVIVWALTGGFVLVYLIGFVAENDPTGRIVALISAALSGGAVIGPFICGHILERFGVIDMCAFTAGAVLTAVMLFVIGRPVSGSSGQRRVIA